MPEEYELLQSSIFGTRMLLRTNPFLLKKIADVRDRMLIVKVDELISLVLYELPVLI